VPMRSASNRYESGNRKMSPQNDLRAGTHTQLFPQHRQSEL